MLFTKTSDNRVIISLNELLKQFKKSKHKLFKFS